jgi:hypothetical protein
VPKPGSKFAPGEDQFTRPLPDTGARPPITAKDIHGNTPKEGDTIKFPGVLGGEGTAKVRWAGPYEAKASGTKYPGQWLGNGILNGSRLPFEIVKSSDKPLSAAEANAAHEAKLKAAGMTQNEYAGLHNDIQAAERKAGELHRAVGTAMDAAPRDAKGGFTPAGRSSVAAAIKNWGDALNGHIDLLNKQRAVDGLPPIAKNESGAARLNANFGGKTNFDSEKFNRTGNLTVSNGNSSAWLAKTTRNTNKGPREYIELKAINSVKAGTGSASRLLDEIKAFADSEGKRIFLQDKATPKSAYNHLPAHMQPDKVMPQKELTAWYERHGFTRLNTVLPDGQKIPSDAMRYIPKSESGFADMSAKMGGKPATVHGPGGSEAANADSAAALRTRQAELQTDIKTLQANGKGLKPADVVKLNRTISAKRAELRTIRTKLQPMDHPTPAQLKAQNAKAEAQYQAIFGKDAVATKPTSSAANVKAGNTASAIKATKDFSPGGAEYDAGKAAEDQATQKAIDEAKSVNNNPLLKTKTIPKVNPGDYQKVRSNGQLAENQISNAAHQALFALGKLSQQSRKVFWERYVEHPGTIAGIQSKAERAKVQTAVDRWRGGADLVNALSNSVATTKEALTPYVQNYAKHVWDLRDPKDRARFMDLVEGQQRLPSDWNGLDNQPRVFKTVAQGKAAGFKLLNEGRPEKDMADYFARSGAALKKQAIIKGVTEADANVPKDAWLDFHDGKAPTPVSKAAQKEMRVFTTPSDAKFLLRAYRTANRTAKRTLLSLSQFHPININLLQAAPAMALKGHEIGAAKAVLGTFGAMSHNESDRIMQKALEDGTIEKAARIGTPVRYGSDFSETGKLTPGGASGERMIFEQQIPAAHVQMVRSVVKDLERKGINLDSPQARDAGEKVNKIMGFMNTELRNDNPKVARAAGDVLLAPQFTRAKWGVLLDALHKGGAGGSYARAAVAGKYLTELGLMVGAGYAVGQQSDNLLDMAKRAAISPAIPTPFKDDKGNNIQLRLPSNYISEAAGIPASLTRDQNGRVQIQGPKSANDVVQNTEAYGRNRLAMIPGDFLKVLTNTDFPGRQLYDNPNAQPGDLQVPTTGKGATQALTTLLASHLPIGSQGITQTNAVESKLPQDVQDVLNQGKGGINPVIKSALSAIGATPQTDKTVGKGLQTTQYFSALDSAKKGLNPNDLAAFNSIHQQTKDPVTGQYIIKPTVFDGSAKATLYLQHPNVLTADTKLNQTLKDQGQTIDPFFNLSGDQQKAYLAYQTMQPGSADRTDWINKNQSWYTDFNGARSAFFDQLPPGDPNRPTAPIQFPEPSAQVVALQKQYDAIPDGPNAGQQKAQFLTSNPALADQFDKQFQYDNALRQARGYAAIKDAPKPSDQLRSFMDTYNAADKAGRASIRNSQPGMYQAMIGFYDAADINGINKTGAVNRLQGEPDQTSQQNKEISNLAKDIYQNADGTYQIVPAGWMQGLTNSSSGYSYSARKSSGLPRSAYSFKTKSLTSHIAGVKGSKVLSKGPKSKSGKVAKLV